MKINKEAIMANLGTFAHAYGLKPKSEMLLNAINQIDDSVSSTGLLLRNPVTKKSLISCYCPLDSYYINDMIWILLGDINVEAVPTFSASSAKVNQSRNWKKHADLSHQKEYDIITNGQFTLTVHQQFRKRGIIARYNHKRKEGFIKRSHRDIYFKKQWCCFNHIERLQEVTFYPIISRSGLQARKLAPIY